MFPLILSCLRDRLTTRNAIKLLKMIGYDASIIKGAECQAGYFIENGVWKI